MCQVHRGDYWAGRKRFDSDLQEKSDIPVGLMYKIQCLIALEKPDAVLELMEDLDSSNFTQTQHKRRLRMTGIMLDRMDRHEEA